MKFIKGLLLIPMITVLFSSAFAGGGDVKKGKTLFNDPKFGGGTAGKSCNSCHPDGKGLEKSADKKEISIMGNKMKSIEEAVNACIKNPMKGKGLDVKSADMVNIVSYLKSLGKKAEKPKKVEEKMPEKTK
ncbi:MAG: hypothetical protein PHX78_04290 [bacterium]|nr:hypothetical protein [bacterium]